MTIANTPSLHNDPDEAERLAALLNATDGEEWTYVVVEIGPRYAIEIYDEDGFRLGCL